MPNPLPHPKYLEQRYRKLSASLRWFDLTIIFCLSIFTTLLYFGLRESITYFWLPIGIFSIFGIFYLFLWVLPIARIKLLSNQLIRVQNTLYHVVQEIDNISEIIPLLESISRQKLLLRMMQYMIEKSPELKKNYWWLTSETLDWLLLVIGASKKLIIKKLNEHTKENAKAKTMIQEVAMTTTMGTSALELQSQRLDLQEENIRSLQKILVRI